MTRAKKNFSPEFREEAVKMVIETSRPIARVAKELGINEGTLGNWVGIYRREHAGEEPPLSVTDRARLREVERENRELKMENDFLKKSRGILRPRSSVTEKFEFIDAEYAGYQESDDMHVPSIVRMCRWMEVSRSVSMNGGTSRNRRPRKGGEIALVMPKSFDDSNETYGYRRVHADLVAWGVPCGREFVRSVMRELGLEPASRSRGGSALPRATAKSTASPIT